MAPLLYTLPMSPPGRAVLLCAKALGLELDIKSIDLAKGEHLTPEYLKMNPQHTIPLLDDNGFILWDSHAIMPYLVEKYGKDRSLYPSDIEKRAVIDQRLHFDSNYLFNRGLLIVKAIKYQGLKQVTSAQKDGLKEAYDIVEKFFENKKYIAGDQLSIADFSYVTTLTSFSLFLPIEKAKYPNITAWLKRMESLPYFNEINKEGTDDFISLFKKYV